MRSRTPGPHSQPLNFVKYRRLVDEIVDDYSTTEIVDCGSYSVLILTDILWQRRFPPTRPPSQTVWRPTFGHQISWRQWRRKQFASEGAQCRRQAPAENFLMCPPLFSCAPHVRGTAIVCYRLRYNWISPSGAIKVMGPILLRLADFLVTTNWPYCVEAVL